LIENEKIYQVGRLIENIIDVEIISLESLVLGHGFNIPKLGYIVAMTKEKI